MRILITGTSGFLGWNLAERLRHEDGMTLFGTHGPHPSHPAVASRALDLQSSDSIEEIVAWSRPDAVIHTAAMSKGLDCEQHPERALRVNGEAIGDFVHGLEPGQTHFIQCSTDLVFDGTHPPYSVDAPTPGHAYGRSKAAGEREALAFRGQATVARLALMFGDGPAAYPSFLGWLHAGLRGDGVTMFRDEIRTAIYVADVVEGLLAIIRNRATGIFHLGGPEPMARDTFARLYARTFGMDESKVRSATLAEAGGQLYRPPDVSLDISRAEECLGLCPRSMQQALIDLREKRSKGRQ